MSDLVPPAELTVLTGASGWFGRAYLAHLKDTTDRRVRVLVPAAADVPGVLDVHPGAAVHVGDIADAEVTRRLLAGAEGADVVHAAGVIHPRRTSEFTRVNVFGTQALLAAARGAGVRRLTHISSNSPFGVNPRTDEVFRHTEPYRPYLGYGESKMHAEIAVLSANGDGLETTVVRPPWFYGEWQPARQTTFFSLCRHGRFPVLGDGSMRRSMTYVGNLIQGVELASRHVKAPGNGYWVADERPYAMREVVDTVRRVLREEGYAISKRQLRFPLVLGALAERADRLLQGSGRYSQELHVLGELDKTIARDIATTTADLGYRPSVALAEGMRRSIRWCRARGIDL
ncbi:NAD-dependent epimerase/dehydratase family protein [Crossiella sp. NPDC003009]